MYLKALDELDPIWGVPEADASRTRRRQVRPRGPAALAARPGRRHSEGRGRVAGGGRGRRRARGGSDAVGPGGGGARRGRALRAGRAGRGGGGPRPAAAAPGRRRVRHLHVGEHGDPEGGRVRAGPRVRLRPREGGGRGGRPGRPAAPGVGLHLRPAPGRRLHRAHGRRDAVPGGEGRPPNAAGGGPGREPGHARMPHPGSFFPLRRRGAATPPSPVPRRRGHGPGARPPGVGTRTAAWSGGGG